MRICIPRYLYFRVSETTGNSSADVVTIINHVTAHEADTEYINKNISAVNKFTDLKDKAHWAFYEILETSNAHKIVSSKNGKTWVK